MNATTVDQLGAEVIADDRPAIETRPLRHGLTAVYLPRALTTAQENELRAALGVPARSTRRRSKAA